MFFPDRFPVTTRISRLVGLPREGLQGPGVDYIWLRPKDLGLEYDSVLLSGPLATPAVESLKVVTRHFPGIVGERFGTFNKRETAIYWYKKIITIYFTINNISVLYIP